MDEYAEFGLSTEQIQAYETEWQPAGYGVEVFSRWRRIEVPATDMYTVVRGEDVWFSRLNQVPELKDEARVIEEGAVVLEPSPAFADAWWNVSGNVANDQLVAAKWYLYGFTPRTAKLAKDVGFRHPKRAAAVASEIGLDMFRRVRNARYTLPASGIDAGNASEVEARVDQALSDRHDIDKEVRQAMIDGLLRNKSTEEIEQFNVSLNQFLDRSGIKSGTYRKGSALWILMHQTGFRDVVLQLLDQIDTEEELDRMLTLLDPSNEERSIALTALSHEEGAEEAVMAFVIDNKPSEWIDAYIKRYID